MSTPTSSTQEAERSKSHGKRTSKAPQLTAFRWTTKLCPCGILGGANPEVRLALAIYTDLTDVLALTTRHVADALSLVFSRVVIAVA